MDGSGGGRASNGAIRTDIDRQQLGRNRYDDASSNYIKLCLLEVGNSILSRMEFGIDAKESNRA